MISTGISTSFLQIQQIIILLHSKKRNKLQLNYDLQCFHFFFYVKRDRQVKRRASQIHTCVRTHLIDFEDNLKKIDVLYGQIYRIMYDRNN